MFKKYFKKEEEQRSEVTPPPVAETPPEDARRSGVDRREEEGNIKDNRRKAGDRRNVLSNAARIIEKYKKAPLFDGLSDDQILKILRICSKRTFGKLQYVYRHGAPSDDLYIVLKGSLDIMLRIDEVWAEVEPLETVGDIEFFIGIPRIADVIANEESVLLKISKTEIKRVFVQDKDLYSTVMRNVIWNLARRIMNDFEEIEQLHYRLKTFDSI